MSEFIVYRVCQTFVSNYATLRNQAISPCDEMLQNLLYHLVSLLQKGWKLMMHWEQWSQGQKCLASINTVRLM